jgi:hypothetical protein
MNDDHDPEGKRKCQRKKKDPVKIRIITHYFPATRTTVKSKREKIDHIIRERSLQRRVLFVSVGESKQYERGNNKTPRGRLKVLLQGENSCLRKPFLCTYLQ